MTCSTIMYILRQAGAQKIPSKVSGCGSVDWRVCVGVKPPNYDTPMPRNFMVFINTMSDLQKFREQNWTRPGLEIKYASQQPAPTSVSQHLPQLKSAPTLVEASTYLSGNRLMTRKPTGTWYRYSLYSRSIDWCRFRSIFKVGGCPAMYSLIRNIVPACRCSCVKVWTPFLAWFISLDEDILLLGTLSYYLIDHFQLTCTLLVPY